MQRIEPMFNADGQPVEINPPTGGNWQRDPDGGLRPADAATAAGAGLEWPAAAPAEIVPDPAPPIAASTKTKGA